MVVLQNYVMFTHYLFYIVYSAEAMVLVDNVKQ